MSQKPMYLHTSSFMFKGSRLFTFVSLKGTKPIDSLFNPKGKRSLGKNSKSDALGDLKEI